MSDTQQPATPRRAGIDHPGPQFLAPGQAPPLDPDEALRQAVSAGMMMPCPDGCGPDETCCKCPDERRMAAIMADQLKPDEAPVQHDRPDEAPERDVEAEQAVPAAAPPPPAQAPPVPLFAGTYAVYDDGSGGVVLVLGQSTGETVHKHIPAGLIRMAERFGGGGIGGLFGGM